MSDDAIDAAIEVLLRATPLRSFQVVDALPQIDSGRLRGRLTALVGAGKVDIETTSYLSWTAGQN